jgi:hypothetical protein
MMNQSIQTHAKHREAFLLTIDKKLSTDRRFVAAWLTGSIARGDQDTLSDIDITLVVADDHCQALCARPRMVSAETTRERYELFCLFGQPALLHENNHNAPEGGTFTFVAYEPHAVMVDWILRPLTGAQKPEEARLLFAKVGVAVQLPPQPESREQLADELSERMAFFWMMTAVTVKYIYRGDRVFVTTWLEQLTGLVSDLERRISAGTWQYRRGSYTDLSLGPDEQLSAIRQLCARMEKLKQPVAKLGGHVPESPMSTIEMLIRIAQEGAETPLRE